ncbi:hypothetical protein [Marinobacter apostichopi]|uniref:hypothetical protein n=1 Tax=Marinobacter apostichopi TaxID=3035454 RepID=UPI002573B05D|nr:hypothetical protein [Marinobacter sp. LA51]
MAKRKTIRFSAGTPGSPYSGMWRMVIKGDDVYLGFSRETMGNIKVSLHQSGVWTLSATQQSGWTFPDGNRRAKRWTRPIEEPDGVGRGPVILVPYNFIGERRISDKERKKKAIWYEAPNPGEVLEFSIYFVKQGVQFNPRRDESILAESNCKSGKRVILCGLIRQSENDFLNTCDKMINNNPVTTNDVSQFFNTSMLWFTQSTDQYQVPIIVDLPVNLKINTDSPMVICKK